MHNLLVVVLLCGFGYAIKWDDSRPYCDNTSVVLFGPKPPVQIRHMWYDETKGCVMVHDIVPRIRSDPFGWSLESDDGNWVLIVGAPLYRPRYCYPNESAGDYADYYAKYPEPVTRVHPYFFTSDNVHRDWPWHHLQQWQHVIAILSLGIACWIIGISSYVHVPIH